VAEAGTREGERDTAFTPILKELVESVKGSLGAVFVDGDGMSVDYFSNIDPYDLKVIGACGALMVQFMGQSRLDPMATLGLSGSKLSLWVLPLGEHYTVTLVLEKRTWPPGLESALARAARRIRREAEIFEGGERDARPASGPVPAVRPHSQRRNR
jgi:hypothetical protein